tara:strand:+ start:890 stop:1045 length:156 start_codon:yes stop_codon:yes gene_type:complete
VAARAVVARAASEEGMWAAEMLVVARTEATVEVEREAAERGAVEAAVRAAV